MCRDKENAAQRLQLQQMMGPSSSEVDLATLREVLLSGFASGKLDKSSQLLPVIGGLLGFTETEMGRATAEQGPPKSARSRFPRF